LILHHATFGSSRNIVDNASWQNIRDQISESMKNPQIDLTEAHKTIQRASLSFKVEHGKETADIVMENERMRTSLMILNQRIKD